MSVDLGSMPGMSGNLLATTPSAEAPMLGSLEPLARGFSDIARNFPATLGTPGTMQIEQIINAELPHLTATLGTQSDLRGKAPDEVWASIGGEQHLPINTTASGPLTTGLTLSTSKGQGQGQTMTGLSSFDLSELSKLAPHNSLNTFLKSLPSGVDHVGLDVPFLPVEGSTPLPIPIHSEPPSQRQLPLQRAAVHETVTERQSTAEPRLRRRWRQRAQPAETGRATRRATGSTARARKHESGDWGSSNDGSDGEDGDDAPFVPRSGESANDAKTRKAKEARAKRMERKRKGTEPSDDKLTRLQKRKVKNRESAARSRNRKQQYTDDLEQEVQKLTQENEELRKQAETKSKDVPLAMVQSIKAGPRLVSKAAAAASAAEAVKRLARASSLAVSPAVLQRATTLPF